MDWNRFINVWDKCHDSSPMDAMSFHSVGLPCGPPSGTSRACSTSSSATSRLSVMQSLKASVLTPSAGRLTRSRLVALDALVERDGFVAERRSPVQSERRGGRYVKPLELKDESSKFMN